MKRSLAILVLAPQPYYIDRGTPIDVDILVRALGEIGHSVDLLCYPHGEDRDWPGVRVIRAATPNWLRRWTRGLGTGFTLRKLMLDWYLRREACVLVRKHGYDVIHAGEEAVFIAMELKHRRGIEYVYDMDSSIAQQLVEKLWVVRPLAPVFNAIEARAIRGALACAPVCPLLGELARSRRAGRVHVLHDISQLPAADDVPQSFPRDASIDHEVQAARERRGSDGRGVVFVYVGNFERYQGVGLLVDAFEDLVGRGTDAELVLVGPDDTRAAKIRARTRGRSGAARIHMVGPRPLSQLAHVLACGDVLVAPRLRGINTPMKVFAYLHSGKPVILTRLPTHTQTIGSDAAHYADPTREGLSEAMEQLSHDAVERRRLGEAGRRFVEREHVWLAHLRRVTSLYDDVCDAVSACRMDGAVGGLGDGVTAAPPAP